MIRVRRHWVVLFEPLLQTVGILIWAFVLSQLVNPASDDVRLAQSFLWYVALGTVLRFAFKVLKWWSRL